MLKVFGKIQVLAATALLFSFSAGAASALSILDTALNPANGHTYYLLSTSGWLDAEAAAVELGSHLVTLNDQAEQDWLYSKWGANRTLMIGLTDAGNEGTFTWTSGEPLTYTRWAPGEPNDGVGWGTTPEDYVYIYDGMGVGYPSYWNDFNGLQPGGQALLYGVVEVVPEPATFALLVLALLPLAARRRA